MQTSLSELKTSGFWYLASPYTSPDEFTRERRAFRANDFAGRLIAEGVHVYAAIWATHRAAKRHALPKDHVFWLAFNAAFLEPAVGVLVADIDGWRESAGCRQEIGFALAAGKPVLLVRETLEIEPIVKLEGVHL